MSTINLDAWGRRNGSGHYNDFAATLPPVAIADDGAGNIYLFFAGKTDATSGVIQKISTAAGVTTLAATWGAWADRAGLTYDKAFGEPISVDEAAADAAGL
ncbi:MAG: hypothetical protein J6P03_08550 [Opitutales bacterium]|nr:hypothetical protein [Opitutales bacterium]